VPDQDVRECLIRLEGHVKDMDRRVIRIEEAVSGNGRPGLADRVTRNETLVNLAVALAVTVLAGFVIMLVDRVLG